MKSHTTATILLVEPHEPTQLVVMLALEPEGLGVFPAHTIKDAIVAARMIRFEACICETRLPDGRGLDLSQQLLQIQPEIRILYYAATATQEEREFIERHGFIHLPKPVCMADLKTTIIQLLPRPKVA